MNERGLAALLVVLLIFSPGLTVALGDEQGSGGLFPAPYQPIFIPGYLSFTFDGEKGLIDNISLNNTLLIESVVLPCEYRFDENMAGFEGSFSSSDYEISYKANETPSIRITALKDMHCSIGWSGALRISDGAFEISRYGSVAVIVTDGEMDKSGSVSLEKGDVLIMRFSGTSNTPEMDLMKALAQSRIGAEISVSGNEWSSMNYDEMNVTALKMRPGLWSFRVSSSDHRGKCLVFHLNESSSDSKISVIVDGHPAKMGGYYDTLFSSGNSTVWNMTGKNGERTVYVYTPSLSEHVISIEEERPGAPAATVTPAGPPASETVFIPVLLAIAISAGALFAAIRRKR